MNIAAIAGDGQDLVGEFCVTDGQRWLVVAEVGVRWHELTALRDGLGRLRTGLDERGYWPGIIWYTGECGAAARFLRDFGFPMMECQIPLFAWGSDATDAVRTLWTAGRLRVFNHLSPRLGRALQSGAADPARVALQIAMVANGIAEEPRGIPLEKQATSYMKDGQLYDNPKATQAHRALKSMWDGTMDVPDWLERAEFGSSSPEEHMKKVWRHLTGEELKLP